MSIRKPSAPRLLPSFSNICLRSSSDATSLVSSRSTVSRMRKTASDAWSSPSTESTPRIWAKRPGTVARGETSSGLRKNWSIARSASPSVERNSPTTLPFVWLSLTRRYSSSIQGSSDSGSPPALTLSRRSARRRARATICSSAVSVSSSAACKYSTAVATSMASAGEGGSPERVVVSSAFVRACARLSLLR